MCGIVAYFGKTDSTAQDVLLTVLRRLEYRGYDQSGLAIFHGSDLRVCKTNGPADALETALGANITLGSVGIGHTRWATHGSSTDERNAHPHVVETDHFTVAIVHNGELTNLTEINEQLTGLPLKSETDSERIAALLGRTLEANVNTSGSNERLQLFAEVLKQLKGSYALALLVLDKRTHDHSLYVARERMPLTIGKLKGGGYIAASDSPSISDMCEQVQELEDGEYALMSNQGDGLYHYGLKHTRWHEPSYDAEVASHQGWPHHTLKEIMEQPQAAKRVQGRSLNDLLDARITTPSARKLSTTDEVLLMGCGTSFHAASFVAQVMNQLAQLRITAGLAHEPPPARDWKMAIALSQSGTSADTVNALKELDANSKYALVNVSKSELTRYGHEVFLNVGIERGVASTKAFTAQVVILIDWLLRLASEREEHQAGMEQALNNLPEDISRLLDRRDEITHFAHAFAKDMPNGCFVIGSGLCRWPAQEMALKLMELTYLHALGYPSGEAKHGPLALVQKDHFGVLALLSQENHPSQDMTAAAINKVRAHQGPVFAIAQAGETRLAEKDHVFLIPATAHACTWPLLGVIVSQLMAYEIALSLGINPDRPRNLAKSVTVR